VKEALQSYDMPGHLERCLGLKAQRTEPDRTTASLAFIRTGIINRHRSELEALEALTGYTKLAESMLLERHCDEHEALPKHVRLMKSRIEQGSSTT
jgi:hypothetical protein